MNLDRAVMAFASLNLFQQASTGLCPAAKLFAAWGIKPRNAFQ